MQKFDYTGQSTALAKAIDIGVDAVRKFPPKNLNDSQLTHFIKAYEQFKTNALNPESKFRNSKSLALIQTDVLTYFQEGHGPAVNYFWQQIKEQNLPYKRENKLVKILKRGKIKDQDEYDLIIDVLVPYQQEGLLNQHDVAKINLMISSFSEYN